MLVVEYGLMKKLQPQELTVSDCRVKDQRNKKKAWAFKKEVQIEQNT